jgi:predicted secreted Zn-dependent protease
MNTLQVAITVVVLLALGGAAIAVFAFDDDGASPPSSRVQAPTAIPGQSPTASPDAATTADTPSPIPSETPRPTEAVPLPDRTSCSEISGTPYRSDTERAFFLENCAAPEPTAAAEEPATSSPTETVVEVAETCDTSVGIETSRSDQTYSVSGVTLDEIVDSMNANAPRIDEGIAYGLTEYSYGIDSTHCVAANNTCSLGDVTISANVVVTLPFLTTLDQLDPELRDLWLAYVERVTIHENRHVRILEEGLEGIKRNLLEIGEERDCAMVDHEVDKVWIFDGSQIDRRQSNFHIADSQGGGGLVVQ